MVIPEQGWSIPADDPQFWHKYTTVVLHGQQPDLSVSEILGSAVVRASRYFCQVNPLKLVPCRTTRTLTLPFITGVFRAGTVAGGNRLVGNELDDSRGLEMEVIGDTSRIFISHDVLRDFPWPVPELTYPINMARDIDGNHLHQCVRFVLMLYGILLG